MSERYRYGYGDEPPDRDRTSTRQGSMTEQRDEQAAETDAADEALRGDAEDEERRADQIREAAADDPQTVTDPHAAADPTDPRMIGAAAEAERPPAADADETDRPSTTSVFDVEEEATAADPDAEEKARAADRDAEEEARAADRDAEERPPIALGPSERSADEAAAADSAAPGGPSDTVLADEPGSDATTVTPVGDTTSSGTATRKPPPLDTTDDLEATDTTDLETAGTAKPEAASPDSGTPTTETPAAVSTGVDGLESEPAVQGSTGTETEMLVPGSGPAPVTTPIDERSALLGSLDADATRARFVDIQAGFVDEPRQAVQEAERFVDELVQTLVRSLESERSKLKATIDEGSTEDLRLALRGYRAFVDRLLNLTM
jgi:hypothetical protein